VGKPTVAIKCRFSEKIKKNTETKAEKVKYSEKTGKQPKLTQPFLASKTANRHFLPPSIVTTGGYLNRQGAKTPRFW
jgi:methyl coenzyme M reductase subunit C-like uncharacterized protein (methanogenesis marker protein 7)